MEYVYRDGRVIQESPQIHYFMINIGSYSIYKIEIRINRNEIWMQKMITNKQHTLEHQTII